MENLETKSIVGEFFSLVLSTQTYITKEKHAFQAGISRWPTEGFLPHLNIGPNLSNLCCLSGPGQTKRGRFNLPCGRLLGGDRCED